MRTAVIFIGLFFAIVAAEEKKECPVMAAIKKGIDACVEALKPSEETLKLVASEKGEDNVEVRCFKACLMNEAGLMENAKFNFDKMEELLRSAEDPNDEEIKAIMGAVKGCKEESEVSDDDCEVAGNYAKCIKAKKDAAK